MSKVIISESTILISAEVLVKYTVQVLAELVVVVLHGPSPSRTAMASMRYPNSSYETVIV